VSISENFYKNFKEGFESKKPLETEIFYL